MYMYVSWDRNTDFSRSGTVYRIIRASSATKRSIARQMAKRFKSVSSASGDESSINYLMRTADLGQNHSRYNSFVDMYCNIRQPDMRDPAGHARPIVKEKLGSRLPADDCPGRVLDAALTLIRDAVMSPTAFIEQLYDLIFLASFVQL